MVDQPELIWWGLQSHFIVKPDLVLRLGWSFDNRNISDVIGSDLYNEIEDALGPLADDITDIISPPSLLISRTRICTESETPGRSSDILQVFRKTPSQLNHNIPRKEPRIRHEISNHASPMRNVGNCSTPQRLN